ncbi:hypothetical protein JMJ56_09820 [Belnapia sp. T18]|uniref:Uncharacterized protein n=1 Tax=Belnapia arida TaxID=2804533 RepID=A0ABS1U0V4_9PROT|nr:hypothetical protein [Belnapia arida]MBL6078302.1 hypothetical protein [Belnapia arida]
MRPALTLLLLLAACATQRLAADKDLLAQGDVMRLATQPAPCADARPECRQTQEIRAEACRRSGDLPCAIAAWQAALGPGSPRRIPLNLAAAAQDAIGTGTGDPARNAAAELLAADALRATDPADPAGCAHAASARLTFALLAPPGPARCTLLAPLPAACRPVRPRPLAAALHRSCP